MGYNREDFVRIKAEFSAAAEKLKETENYPTRRELDLFMQKKSEHATALLEKEQAENSQPQATAEENVEQAESIVEEMEKPVILSSSVKNSHLVIITVRSW